MFNELNNFHKQNKIFEEYTTIEMWNDPHISKQMLEFHLNPDLALASRGRNFISESVKFIIDKFNMDQNKSVVDFGCGPGLYTTEFAKTGAWVTGIDVSENSISYAEKMKYEKKLNINYVQKNYLDFQTDKKFDLVTMIFCDFCVLNPAQRNQLLNIFSSVLKSGGKIIFDLFSEKFFENMPLETNYEYCSEGGFWSDEAYHLFSKTFKYEKEKTILLKYLVIEETRKRTFYNYLKSFTEQEIISELKNFSFGNFEVFNNVKGEKGNSNSDTICIVAEKTD